MKENRIIASGLITALAVVAMAAVTLTFSSCGKARQSAGTETLADSLIKAAIHAQNIDRLVAVCDSLQLTGDISLFQAAYHRGVAYIEIDKMRPAENELKRAMAEVPQHHQDSIFYYQCVSRLVEVQAKRADYEGALHTALPVIEKLKREAEKESSLNSALTKIYDYMGVSQLNLGMKEEAAKSFDQSFSYAQKAAGESSADLVSIALVTQNFVATYINVKDYHSAHFWLSKLDSLTEIVAANEDIPSSRVDDVVACDYLANASVFFGLNNPEDANRAFAKYQETQLAKTNWGKVEGGEFLFYAKRYAEAADAYAALDPFYIEWNIPLNLDNMKDFSKKFSANYKAGRSDSALAVAAYAFEYLDSALTLQRKNDAAELATIYETQQKDAEIAQQQISLSWHRWIGTLVALALLTTFFIIYAWYRRRAENRLGEAHAKLQKAYDQLEETTAAKERIESELRIARDIQMSMVPRIFPNREGLDMYAEMTPAKEVGGDLYGYVYLPAPNGEGQKGVGERLYFCVGDVSGKGVPASLFMAQSARLFRTLAAEGMMPADIAFRMNNALAENNDRGMFVTMFIGLLHLDTGHLDFCNCGHNPPILDGQFLQMQYDNQPLGLWEDDPFEGESIEDIRGRQLLVYTDGLNEAENAQHELLGNARLLELMSDTAALDSHQVIDMLKDAVEQHRIGADSSATINQEQARVEPNDDLTLLCITLKIHYSFS